jgi:hypothetical protein
MHLVIIESPWHAAWAGDAQENRIYAAECLKNSLLRGEAPFSSHALYAGSGALDDCKPPEREAGMLAGFAVIARSDFTAVYIDRGISPGMRRGIAEALRLGNRVVYRTMKRPTEDMAVGLASVQMAFSGDE